MAWYPLIGSAACVVNAADRRASHEACRTHAFVFLCMRPRSRYRWASSCALFHCQPSKFFQDQFLVSVWVLAAATHALRAAVVLKFASAWAEASIALESFSSAGNRLPHILFREQLAFWFISEAQSCALGPCALGRRLGTTWPRVTAATVTHTIRASTCEVARWAPYSRPLCARHAMPGDAGATRSPLQLQRLLPYMHLCPLIATIRIMAVFLRPAWLSASVACWQLPETVLRCPMGRPSACTLSRRSGCRDVGAPAIEQRE